MNWTYNLVMSYLLFTFSDIALLILRVVMGAVFIVHGWPKIKDLHANAKGFDKMGFRPGILWGTIVAFLEFFGGITLIAGFLTQVVGLLLAVQMLVAAVWKIKNKQRFAGGYELDIALLAMGLILATSGAGAFALDNLYSLFIY